MKQEESKKCLKDFMKSSKNARENRNSLSNAEMKLRLIRSAFKSSTQCLKLPSSQLKMSLRGWMLRRAM
jgi:hypothetical protein